MLKQKSMVIAVALACVSLTITAQSGLAGRWHGEDRGRDGGH
jgi:hypothetical protein